MIPRDTGVPSYPGFTSFLFFSLSLSFSPAVYSVGNCRYVGSTVYSKHNVIADIGRRRSRYTHLFSSCSPDELFRLGSRPVYGRMEICTPAKYYSVGDPSRSRSLFPHYSARSFVRSFFHRFCATVRLYARASMLRNANTRKGTKPRERVNERARPCTHGKFGASPTKTPKKLGAGRGEGKKIRSVSISSDTYLYTRERTGI